MRIIGCDLHARQQTLAMLDTTTGVVLEATLKHEGDKRAGVLFLAAKSGASGYRSHGIDAVVFKSPGGAVESNALVGHPAQIRAVEPRKQKK